MGAIRAATSAGLVRFRTRDGRYLSGGFTGVPGGGLFLGGGLHAVPGPPTHRETFAFSEGTDVPPLIDGGAVAVAVCASDYTPILNRWTVFHHFRAETPEKTHGFFFGGPDSLVTVENFAPYPPQAGFPYFALFNVRVSAGEVSVFLGPGLVETRDGSDWFFRVADDGFVYADGTAPFQDDTAFIVESGPFECAKVTGSVADAASLQPIAGAKVVTDGGFAGTTDLAGSFSLRDAQGQDCIPDGPRSVIASADRYQTGEVMVTVPGQGSVHTDIQLGCTVVEGIVVQSVDGKELPLGGEVTLTYVDTGEGLVATADPVTGQFRFVCVRHTRVHVETDQTSAQDVNMGNPIPDTGVKDIKIVVPGPGVLCPVITGTVIDATTLAPIAGATVTVLGTLPPSTLTAQTDAKGRYTITNVCLTGIRSVKASATGYASDVQTTGMLPVTGTVTVDFKLKKLQRILKLRPTGVDSNDAQLKPGDLDPHWQLVAGPGVTTPRAPFVVTNQRPFGQYFTTTDSRWIGQDAAGSANVGSPYTFQQTFDLTGFNPASVTITGFWGVDNNGVITLNGQAPQGSGLSLTGAVLDNFNLEHQFTITGGFTPGMNTLDIQVTNTGGPAGLNVTRLTISATPE